MLARYGLPVRSVYITKIESLQRGATKFILNTHWQEDISYHERLSRLNLLSLTSWHEVKDLIFYFKCRAGHYTLPIADYFKPKGTRLTRHSSDQDVLIPKCRTKLFQFSYFIVLLNSGIRYLYPLVLLVISLNLTYSNAIRLLFVQTMTLLTLTPEVDLLQM